jgi:alpha-galactosidase
MLKRTLFFILLMLITVTSFAQEAIAQRPPMGWMTWNMFGGNISDSLIRETADAMVASGMAEVGYEYLIIDDLWQGGRGEDGRLQPDADKFPHGIKALADYVHSKGLKLGIYSNAAEFTCAGATGSLAYEEVDAQTFADWGIDYLKYDYCGAPEDVESAKKLYSKMKAALLATGRPILFAVCEWGPREPWKWARQAGGNIWRTTWDIRDTWEAGQFDNGHAGIMEILDRQVELADFAGPGGWNDPDMLVVGLYGNGAYSNRGGASGCSTTEYRSQFSLWALLAAPLIAANDIRTMNAETLEILTNREVIAINQDKLGQQAKQVFKDGSLEIWAKELDYGAVAIGLLNRDATAREMTLDRDLLKLDSGYLVRNVWQHANLDRLESAMTFTVESHEVILLVLMPKAE